MTASTTSLSVSGLSCESRYFFRISANGDGNPYDTDFGPTAESGGIDTQDCPEASISESASIVDEGGTATFTVSLDKAVSVDLTIGITVTETGSHLSHPTPTGVTIRSGLTSASFDLAVQNDNVLSLNRSISVTLRDGAMYDLNSQDLGAWVAAVTIRPYAAAPTVTSVTDTSADGVAKAYLDWDEVDGVDVYRVERGFTSTGPWTKVHKITPFDPIDSRTLTPDGDYPFECGRTNYFVVSARGNGTDRVGEYGPRSAAMRFDAPGCEAPAPDRFSGTASSPYAIGLTWLSVNDAEEYRIERRTSGDTVWVHIDDVAASTTSLTVSGLTCESRYFFRISANGDGDPYDTDFGPTSESGGIDMQDCPEASISEDANVVDEGGTATFTVSLDKPVTVDLTIGIAVTETGSHLTHPTPTVITVSSGLTSASLDLAVRNDNILALDRSITVSLQDGATYDLNSQDLGAWVAAVTIRPYPAAPTVTSVTDASADGVDKVYLDWDAVDGVDVYRVERGFTSTGPWIVVHKITPFDPIDTRTLTPGGDYPFECGRTNYFVISARGNGTTHAADNGPRSAATRFDAPQCKAPPPPDLTVTERTLTTLSLSWSEVDGAANYRLETSSSDVTEWTTAADVAHGTTEHTLRDLACSTGKVMHYFRISANGDGDLYQTEYGAPSDVRGPVETLPCPVITITAGSSAIDEGETAVFTVTSGAPVPEDVTVRLRVVETESYLADAPPTSVSIGEGETTFTLDLSTMRADIDGSGDTITVTLRDGDDYSLGNPASAQVTIRPYTSAPTVTSVTDTSADGVDKVYLGWDSVAGVDIYRVERGFASTGPWTVVHRITPFDPIDTRTLTPGGDYPFECGRTNYFVISARGNGTTHAADNGPRSAATRFDAPQCKAPPPPDLTVTERTLTTLSLSWSEVDGAANYRLETSSSDVTEWTTAADVAHGTTEHTLRDLACSTGKVMHYFRISANGDGDLYQTEYGAPSDVRGPVETLPCPVITITAGSSAIDEGETAVFTVTSGAPVPEDVTVRLRVVETASYLVDVPPTVVSIDEGERTFTLDLSTMKTDIDGSGDTVTVTLRDGDDYSLGNPASAQVTIRPYPAAPTVTSVTGASADGVSKVHIDWDTVAGADVYRVERGFTSTGPWTVVHKITPFDPVGPRTLTPGGEYPFECGRTNFFVVSARGNGTTHAADYGPRSAARAYDPPDCYAPPPSALTVTNVTDSTVKLTWAEDDDAAAYRVQVFAHTPNDSGSWEPVENGIDVDGTTFTVMGLNCASDYSFRVSAKGTGSPYVSTYSDFFAVTPQTVTTACPAISITAPTPIPDLPFGIFRVFEGEDAPFTVTASPPFAAQTDVRIATVADGAARIDGTAPTTVTFPANTDPNAVSVSVTLAVPTREHADAVGRGTVTVTLQGDQDRYVLGSAASASITVDDDDLPQLSAPAAVTVTAPADAPATARLTWTAANGVDRYEIQHFLPGSTAWEDADPLPGNHTPLQLDVPTNCGESYQFRVRALGDGQSHLAVYTQYSTISWTSAACLILAPPSDLEADGVTLTTVDLSWSPVTGGVAYKLEYKGPADEDWTVDEFAALGVNADNAVPTGTGDVTRTVADLICRTTYSFRVSVKGNGRLYEVEYGDASDVIEASTESSYATCPDRSPSFGSETIANISADVGQAITPVTLPEATGGDYGLTYSFDEDTPLPNGLTFDPGTRILSGTPTQTSCGAFVYTVTDADPTDPDSDTISVNIFVLDPDRPSPEFVVSSIPDWTYSVTANATALQLPAAVGGFGPLRYSITPELPAGMSFNPDTFIISGVPTATLATTQYTYTVRNRADCASSDSDSITFSITIPTPTVLEPPYIQPTGVTATGNDAAGTITLSWNPDDSPGYQIRHWVTGSIPLWPHLPSGSFTITCGGRIATVCPPDATSAVISGFTTEGDYYHRLTAHNGIDTSDLLSHDFTSVTLSPARDVAPAFETAAVTDRVVIKDRPIDLITLPIATGGNWPLSYSLTPDLPPGLSFNHLTRTISGTPTGTIAATEYTYAVIDSDARNPDTVVVTFRIEVADAMITITNLPARMAKDDLAEFTVEVTDTPEIGDVEIVVEAFGGAGNTSSATASDIGFNTDCTDIDETDSVASDVSSHTATFTLHACDAQYNQGGIISAYLTNNGMRISDIFEADVIVTPIVTITGFRSPAYPSEEIEFTVQVSDIAKSRSYSIEVTAYGAENTTSSTTDSDLGFNSGCSTVEESDSFTTGVGASPEHAESYTLRMCDHQNNGGGVITASILEGETVLAGDWFYIEALPITVSIEANNIFPITGDEDEDDGPDTVTLRAVTDAPTGMSFTYQWQEKDSEGDWADITDASDSTYKMADETSSNTRTIRVEAASVGQTYVSEEVSITWDLGQMLRTIVDSLTDGLTATPTPTAFQDAEENLLDCVENAPTNLGGGTRYSSFAHLMTKNEAGSTLAALLETEEDQTATPAVVGCKDDLDEAWNAIENSFADTFNSLRTTGTNATATDAFLSTDAGQEFVTYLTAEGLQGLRTTTLHFVVPTAKRLALEPEYTTPDDQGNPAGDSSHSTREDPEGNQTMVDGCLTVAGISHTDLDDSRLEQRFDALECLIYKTHHLNWIVLAQEVRELREDDTASTPALDEYKNDINEQRSAWLRAGNDFICSPEIGPDWFTLEFTREVFGFARTLHGQAVCLKHDLAWNTLQHSAGPVMPDAEAEDALDEAWHPRNKLLADVLFLIDGNCPLTSSISRRECMNDNNSMLRTLIGQRMRYVVRNVLTGVSRLLQRAGPIFEGVADFTDNNWPITEQDISHVQELQEFVHCPTQRPELGNQVWSITSGADGRFLNYRWDALKTCSGSSISEVRHVKAEIDGTSITLDVRLTSNSIAEGRLQLPAEMRADSVRFTEARLDIANVVFGKDHYFQDLTEL